MHDGEETLLHFSGILGTENGVGLIGEVALDAGANCLANSLDGERALQFSSVEDVELDLGVISEISFEFLDGGLDQHVLHEEGVIGSGDDVSDWDSEVRVPTKVAINHIEIWLGVEILDGEVSAESVDFWGNFLVV